MLATNIEISIKETQSTTEKGNILEELASTILSIQQYEVTNKVRVTGMEIDLLAKHKISNSTILVECKAHEGALSADAISKLLGNVIFRGASAGWLMSTGPLTKDAEGLRFDWENRTDAQREKLSFYTPDRIIQTLIDARIVVAPETILENLRGKFNLSQSATLLLIPNAQYWLIPVVDKATEFVTSIIAVNAKNGEQVTEKEQLEEIKSYKNNYSSYQWLSSTETDTKYAELLKAEYNSIVPVISGDDWTDYRPARPEDFVGRKNLLHEIFSFFDGVNSNSSSTRLFAIKAPSGMGKSSIVLKIASMANERKYAQKYFVYAVDVRTAMSSRYVEIALKSCFKKADSSGFTNVRNRSIDFTTISQFMESASIQKTLKYLDDNSKTIVLIFDQFEELFSKKELYPLFDNIRALCNMVDSMQGQLVLGFAWKTDLTIPAEHPAYYMWSNLADHRKEFELGQFKSSEIKSAINLFGKQLGEKINPILRNYLTKQCQGYPWLLKKLCIHVFRLINEGSSQDSVIGQRLNIVDLFNRDISDLTPEQHACLKEIAKSSPADYFTISEIYGNEMVQTLVNSRLVIRRASKLTLYWDIFRDYILNNVVPNLLLDYIPQMQFSSVANVLRALLKNDNISSDTLSKTVGINVATIDNIMIDAVMFGVAKKENAMISLLFGTEEDLIIQMQAFFKKHIMYQKMMTSYQAGFTYVSFYNAFEDIYLDSNISEKTRITYCSKLYNWFIRLGLFTEDTGKTYIVQTGVKTISFALNNRQRRSRNRYYSGEANLFWGQTSPQKMEQAFNEILSGNHSYAALISQGFRNAIELLSASQAIHKEGDSVTTIKSLQEIYDFISNAETILFTQQLMDITPHIRGAEIGPQVVILNAKEHEAPRTGRFGSIAFIFLYHNRAGKSSGRAKR